MIFLRRHYIFNPNWAHFSGKSYLNIGGKGEQRPRGRSTTHFCSVGRCVKAWLHQQPLHSYPSAAHRARTLCSIQGWFPASPCLLRVAPHWVSSVAPSAADRPAGSNPSSPEGQRSEGRAQGPLNKLGFFFVEFFLLFVWGFFEVFFVFWFLLVGFLFLMTARTPF